jgi:hypothetical protein
MSIVPTRNGHMDSAFRVYVTLLQEKRSDLVLVQELGKLSRVHFHFDEAGAIVSQMRYPLTSR